MSFLDAREHGSKPGSGGAASAQNEVFIISPFNISPPPSGFPARPPGSLQALLLSLQQSLMPAVRLRCSTAVGRCVTSGLCITQAIDRRERLRRLALETIDLSKDPYFMRNHLGQYECRLCLTLHNNEGNYLAHTQARSTPAFGSGSQSS